MVESSNRIGPYFGEQLACGEVPMSDQEFRESSSRRNRDSAEPRPSRLESTFDDVVGVDFKIGRTLRDLVLRPGGVADAALAGDESRYTRPLKVYLALLALLTLAFAWAGLGETSTLTGIYANSPAQLAYVETRLAEVGSSVAAADEVARKWIGWTNWPINAVASLIFVLAIWAMRPRLGLYPSFLLYLVASNAASVVTFPVVIAAIYLGRGALLAASLMSIFFFLFYAALVMHRRAADTALGLGFRVAGLVVMMVPTVVAVIGISVAMLEIAFRNEIGLSRLKLLAGAQAAATQRDPAPP